jgi:hypothetical protein
MSNNRHFSLHESKARTHEIRDNARNVREAWHETFGRHTGTRQRVRLIAHGLASYLHDTAKDIKVRGRHAAKQVGVRMALLASHKLITIAERIERKARVIQKSR